jgi:glutathione synthase
MKNALAMVMDPIHHIKPYKDTSFAMLLEAQRRGIPAFYLEMRDLFLRDGVAYANAAPITVRDQSTDWFTLGEYTEKPLGAFRYVFMRKDPPFDMEYIYATYILEQAQRQGARVINDPRSLRDCNEKLFTAWFPQCCPPNCVTRDAARIKHFIAEQGKIVLKPLDGMGGKSIFVLAPGEPNTTVIIDTLTEQGSRFVMAQRYLPDIVDGDKRILMIQGNPIPYALARIPAQGETRGNLAAGGRGEGRPLTARDYWLCEQIGPALRERGLHFVGLDVIGDYVTEINVTSPTCARELDAQFNLNITGTLFDALETSCA